MSSLAYTISDTVVIAKRNLLRIPRQPYLLTRPLDIDVAHGRGPPGAAEAHGAEGDCRDAEAGSAELSILHAAESKTTHCEEVARPGLFVSAPPRASTGSARRGSINRLS